MEEKEPLEEESKTEEEAPKHHRKKLRERWREFRARTPRGAKAIIAVLIFISVAGAAFSTFTTYNFTQNNPKFCNSCHIMNDAYAAWEGSVHKDINCHECHHLSPSDLNTLMVSAFIRKTEKVPVRYGKVIVPWKSCMSCHWEDNEHYPEVAKINKSEIHARHYFIEKIECSKCHGYKVHQFKPEEKFCLSCHKNRQVHGKGMGGLACLNCHTDRTDNMLPGREKCLFCHGGDIVRDELILDGTIDVKYFRPSKEIINSATKIKFTKDSPMQFNCYNCHKPHEKVRPDYGTCMSCHPQIVNVGKHRLHIHTVGLECTECHKKHTWRVTEKIGKELCSECHDYQNPMKFINADYKADAVAEVQ